MYAAAAEPPHDPPAHCNLPAEAKPFWDALIVLKPRDYWTAADLESLVDLCRLRADVERVWQEVRDEGETITTPQGSTIANPKALLLLKMRNQVISVTRAIRIDAATIREHGREKLAKKMTEYEKARRQQKAIAESDNVESLLAGGMA
jgi:hypothetical protein